MKRTATLAAGLVCLAGTASAQTAESPRVVVTGVSQEGRAVVVHDGPPTEVLDFDALPGYRLVSVWGTAPGQALPGAGEKPGFSRDAFVPEPGGTHFVLVRLPTPAQMGAAAEDPQMMEKLTAQMSASVPDLIASISQENPALHATASIDYVVVLSGTVIMELDDGATVTLGAGDMVVQNGTAHGWINGGEEPALMAAVLVGASPPDGE